MVGPAFILVVKIGGGADYLLKNGSVCTYEL
jgi:hypothetical protein